MRGYTTLLVASAMTAACATGTRVTTAGGELAPVTPPNGSWIPAGTSMVAKLNQSIGTESSRKGDTFTATVVNPVYAQDGFIAVPAGSLLRGRITGVHNSSIPGEQSVIRLAFEDIQMRGKTYPVTASISNVVVEKQATPTTSPSLVRNAVAGGGAGAGTVVSGADLSKMIAGGVLGAATGTVISLGSGGTEGVMPAGSTFTVRTNDNVRVR